MHGYMAIEERRKFIARYILGIITSLLFIFYHGREITDMSLIKYDSKLNREVPNIKLNNKII